MSPETQLRNAIHESILGAICAHAGVSRGAFDCGCGSAACVYCLASQRVSEVARNVVLAARTLKGIPR